MSKSTFAKIFGYVGSAAVALGQSNFFGKFSGLAVSVGAILGALGIHQASNSDGNK